MRGVRFWVRPGYAISAICMFPRPHCGRGKCVRAVRFWRGGGREEGRKGTRDTKIQAPRGEVPFQPAAKLGQPPQRAILPRKARNYRLPGARSNINPPRTLARTPKPRLPEARCEAENA